MRSGTAEAKSEPAGRSLSAWPQGSRWLSSAWTRRPLCSALLSSQMPKRKGVASLSSLCLGSVAQHMQGVWVKDYSENYLDEYHFRYIMGPFNELAGCLVQDLLKQLGESRRLTRAALHLLLVPHLRELSLRACPSLVSNAIAQLVATRCNNLCSLDLHGCSRVSAAALTDLLEGLPLLTGLDLAETQADIRVLSAVGSCCRRLRQLDISGCRRVTPEALLHLAYDPTAHVPCCPALRVLLASGIEPQGRAPDLVGALAFLLLALPSLEVLASSCVMEALCLIHTQCFQDPRATAPPGFPSLKELAQHRQGGQTGGRDAWLTLPLKRVDEVEEPFLTTLCAVCPEAEEVTVALNDGPSACWDSLAWGRLSCLVLHCTGPRGRGLAETVPLVRSLGPRLRSLTLHGFTYDDELSLSALLDSCPSLHTFSTHLCTPAEPPWTPDGDAELHDWAPNLVHHSFPQLQHFSLALSSTQGPLPGQHMAVLRAILAAVLSCTQCLETLQLLCLPFSLDGLFQAVLQAPGPVLCHLQELSLAESQVSSSTVRLLLTSDGPLRTLNLVGCRDIHRRDYDQFIRTVQEQQLQLDITWQ
ncbi:uncharacterized protein LOC102571682 isoform X2 [Alligator mississippiensis]|uniref:uncharacterized protein LOC102571682 isoform X2 n=2 Tax=Alligator mississippiensis TaxID=8496 RepID=UPI00090715E6|nr:uncharacterized protein LOC102571682 isoform X2 [Alligator mississippiensis]